MATSNEAGSKTRPWEDLDKDLEAHATVAPPEQEKAIDDALGLQLISIRLQRSLLGNLKAIAQFYGVGYQPLIRDLLNRFARSEIQNILRQLEEQKQQLERMEQEKQCTPAMEPIDRFLEREGAMQKTA